MTTTITVSTNGNYVSEGLLITENEYIQSDPNGGAETYTRRTETVKVGPGSQNAPATAYFNVPHGAEVTLEISEREAFPEEIAAVTPPTA